MTKTIGMGRSKSGMGDSSKRSRSRVSGGSGTGVACMGLLCLGCLCIGWSRWILAYIGIPVFVVDIVMSRIFSRKIESKRFSVAEEEIGVGLRLMIVIGFMYFVGSRYEKGVGETVVEMGIISVMYSRVFCGVGGGRIVCGLGMIWMITFVSLCVMESHEFDMIHQEVGRIRGFEWKNRGKNGYKVFIMGDVRDGRIMEIIDKFIVPLEELGREEWICESVYAMKMNIERAKYNPYNNGIFIPASGGFGRPTEEDFRMVLRMIWIFLYDGRFFLRYIAMKSILAGVGGLMVYELSRWIGRRGKRSSGSNEEMSRVGKFGKHAVIYLVSGGVAGVILGMGLNATWSKMVDSGGRGFVEERMASVCDILKQE